MFASLGNLHSIHKLLFFFFLGGGGIHVTKSSVHVEGAAAVNIVAPILQIKADKEQLIIDILQLT